MADVPGECGDGSDGAEATAGDDDLVFDILRRRLMDVCAPGGIPGSYPPPRATELVGLAHSLDARLRESVLLSRAVLAANERLCATLPPFATEHHGARLASSPVASIAHDIATAATASRSSSPHALFSRARGGCVPSLAGTSRAARLARAPPVPPAALPVALPVRATSTTDIHDRLTSHTSAPQPSLERAAREAKAEDPTSLVVAPVLAYESPRLERLGARGRDRRDGANTDYPLDERTPERDRRERLRDENVSPALADAPTGSAPAGVLVCKNAEAFRDAEASRGSFLKGRRDFGPGTLRFRTLADVSRDASRETNEAAADAKCVWEERSKNALGRDARTRGRARRGSRIRETSSRAAKRTRASFSFDGTNASGSRLASDPAFVAGANHVCEHAELAEFVSAPDTDALAMKAWTTWERGTNGPVPRSDGFRAPTGSA